MADNKIYYYMRLKDNFFDTNEMVVLESLQDGYLYSNILLKLYLRSLRDNGKLMFNEAIPYNSQMIATITRHQVGTVERALRIFQKMGLIEILDSGAIYMLNIQNYIGRASTEADRKRDYRKRIESEKISLLGTTDKCPDISTPEIELEKDIDTDTEKEIESETEKKKEIEKGIVNTPQAVHHPLFFEPQNEPQSGLQREEDDESIMTIRYFFTRYLIKTGQKHDPVSAEKMEEIKRRFDETGVYRDYVDVYFGDEDHKGLCGDSDCKIFHFSSPGVLEVIKKRLT